MEPHKELPSIENYRPDFDADAHTYFNKALDFVTEFYLAEVGAFMSVEFDKIDADFFFREYVWVVHATGFSAKAVGKFMPRLIGAYGIYDDLAEEEFEVAFERVRKVCNNSQKAKAVWKTARLMKERIDAVGWDEFKKERLLAPHLLKELSYVGPVTCFHLARNIGLLQYVKPDLHLVRMAEHWGYSDCVEMCRDVQPGDLPLGIVDLIFWYSASHFSTLSIRKPGGR